MAKCSVLRSGVVLISKFNFQNFVFLRSASSLDPASKIFEFCVSDNFKFEFKASYSVLFIQVSAILVSYILRPFSLNNLMLIGDPEI